MERGQIIRALTAFFLIFTLPTFSVQAQILSGILNVVPAAVSCSPPLFTSDWAAWNPSNICYPTSTCSDGEIMKYNFDSIGGNTASNPSGSQPTYHTNQVNGLAANTFAGSQFFNLTTGIPQTNNFTFWAVVKLASSGGGLFGYGTGAFAWVVTPTSQYVASDNVGVGGYASASYGTSTWVTVAVTYNSTSGAYAFYTCSGGTCTNIGSGTDYISLSSATTRFGDAVYSYFNGQVAEAGYYNGISTAGIGAWSKCKYGI
jgi:hypothetical protein